jgi:hypothetical protein
VDTPRRARASIGKGVDDDVAFISQLLDKSRPRAGHFPSGNELNTFVSLPEKLTHMSEKFIGIRFVVVQKTNALVAQAAVSSGSELSSLRDSERRWIHNLYQLSVHARALQNRRFRMIFFSPRIYRRSYNELAIGVKGRIFLDNAMKEFATDFQLGLCEFLETS